MVSATIIKIDTAYCHLLKFIYIHRIRIITAALLVYTTLAYRQCRRSGASHIIIKTKVGIKIYREVLGLYTINWRQTIRLVVAILFPTRIKGKPIACLQFIVYNPKISL